MTDVQRKTTPSEALETEYTNIAVRVRRILASRYPLQACLPPSPDYPPGDKWREVWELELEEAETPVRILLAIPFTFPDSLPAVYLPTEVARDIGHKPHLDRNRFLCTLDGQAASPNADRPEDVAEAVIQRACLLLSEGIGGRNREDFAEEFTAYWNDDCSEGQLSALSLLPPSGTSRRIKVCEPTPSWRSFRLLFAETNVEATRWFSAVGYSGKIRISEGLYVALSDFGCPPFPSSNQELYQRLQQCDAAALGKILSFLKSSERPAWILASVPTATGRTLIGWAHPAFISRRRGTKGYIDVPGSIPGFRPKHQPSDLELTTIYPKGVLTRSNITQVHRERLLERTSGRAPAPYLLPATVIGCGSVGSFLAEGLARSGLFTKMGLVDREVLMPENTFRHLCGMSDIGQPKAVATAQRVMAHFPHVSIKTFNQDILDLLRTSPDTLADTSLNIIALGNLSVERRLNRLLYQAATPFAFPACFVWVEPHLYGGHAIYLPAQYPGCLECLFDDKFRFRHRIVTQPERFMSREHGCQSTYVPYSGTDLIQFVAATVRFILSQLASPTVPSVFSWTGDLNQARRADVSLNQNYLQTESFTGSVRPLVPNRCCPICRPS